jgi:hypothetical protein
MKKKFLFGMIALLSVSLFVLGCSTDSDDDDDPPPPKTSAELAQELAEYLEDASFDGDTATVTLGAAVTLTEDLTVPAGVTLETDEYTLTVNGVSIAVNGTLSVESTGGLNIGSTGAIIVGSGGELIIEDGIATGDLDGTITVRNGGTTYDKHNGGNSLWGGAGGSTGKYVYEAGSKAYVYNDKTEGDDLSIGASGDDARLTFAPGATGNFTLFEKAYEINVDISLNKDFAVDDGTIATIAPGKTFTIGGEGTTLYIRTTAEPRSIITGGQGSTIILNNGNSIRILDNQDRNFYDNSGTLLNQNYTASGGDKTFTWNAALADNAGGWQLPAEE